MSTPNDSNKFEDSLNVLQNLGRANPSDQFEERLFAKLEAMAANSQTVQKSRWYYWSAAALLSLMLGNVFLIYEQQQLTEDQVIEELWSTNNALSFFDELTTDDLKQ